jgi:hypothetical protein
MTHPIKDTSAQEAALRECVTRLANAITTNVTPIESAAKALAKLSDAEWLQVKRDEERRRADQRIIRDLSSRYRELRDREPAR